MSFSFLLLAQHALQTEPGKNAVRAQQKSSSAWSGWFSGVNHYRLNTEKLVQCPAMSVSPLSDGSFALRRTEEQAQHEI